MQGVQEMHRMLKSSDAGDAGMLGVLAKLARMSGRWRGCRRQLGVNCTAITVCFEGWAGLACVRLLRSFWRNKARQIPYGQGCPRSSGLKTHSAAGFLPGVAFQQRLVHLRCAANPYNCQQL